MKVVIAMSGGVDSSVAAAILKKEGYEVIGITMQIWSSARFAKKTKRFDGCCGLQDIADAKRVAYRLDIPHYVVNFENIFGEKVITNFYHEYSLGRTPNPCIRCNQFVKFDALLKRAKELGADFIATGHYARIEKNDSSDRYLLKKGVDRHKDQSYFLYTMAQEQLIHGLFPLGNLTKEIVRTVAARLELPIADKPESQDICFISDNDYPKFIKEYVTGKVKPGPILDQQGNILGEHRGIIFYTIGQRKGLGISAEEALYVMAIDRERNSIIVGRKEDVYGTKLTVSELNWIAMEVPEYPMRVKAKIRYSHQEAWAILTTLRDNKLQVIFEEPQMAVAPGQAIVFYDGDIVLGGGLIE